MRFYCCSFDVDASEILQEWPAEQARDKCSISWIGRAWFEERRTPPLKENRLKEMKDKG